MFVQILVIILGIACILLGLAITFSMILYLGFLLGFIEVEEATEKQILSYE